MNAYQLIAEYVVQRRAQVSPLITKIRHAERFDATQRGEKDFARLVKAIEDSLQQPDHREGERSIAKKFLRQLRVAGWIWDSPKRKLLKQNRELLPVGGGAPSRLTRSGAHEMNRRRH
jgi:hypothetical protein